jgi:DNA-binding XRE family transcriptional regulator
LDLGLLQKEVAAQIGVDEATIYNWEANRNQPAVRLIPRIIQFLGYGPQVQEVAPATPAGNVIA